MTNPLPTLRVAALQLDIEYGNPEENLKAVEKILEVHASEIDLLVVPELFTTRFIASDEQIEQIKLRQVKTLSIIKKFTSVYQIAIAGSFLDYNNEVPVNRGFIVIPDGEGVYYDKRHLFCLSPEHRLAKRGKIEPPVISYRGWNLSIIICYDLRFPVWCRNRDNRYDVMIVPANWPTVRQYAWKHLLISRAIENQAFYIGANCAGKDMYGDYDNSSYIIDEHGYSIGEITGNLVIATFSKEKLQNYRKKLPVWRDADQFSIEF